MGRQQGMGGDGAGANVPSACTSGPRGLALGGGSRPALHLLLPPPHPAGASPEEREQLVLFPRKVHTSTLCSGGQRGRVLAWASGPCAHTPVPRPSGLAGLGQRQPHSSQQTPEVAGDGRNSWESPDLPRGPAKGKTEPADPTSGERGPRREQQVGELLSQEDKRQHHATVTAL